MEEEFGAFMVGLLARIALAVVITISSLSGERTITTDKKIVLEWELTTDGKKIDTLYIYKQK